MKNIENKAIVLKLNKHFIPVGVGVVKDTIVDLVTGVVKAIDIIYAADDNGEIDYDKMEYMNPVTWADWITLPILKHHLCIHSPKLTIRVPTVVVTTNYSKIHFKKFKGKPTREGIFIRDGGIDGYSGKEIDYDDLTLDHILPLSRGGTDTYSNVVGTDKTTNNRKGNRLNHEVGLKLFINPRDPSPIPISQTIRSVKLHDWKHFLFKTNKYQ